MNKKNKFFWGASTASHQVEGNTYNQWTVWELENAKQLAKNSKKTLGWMPNYEDIKDKANDPNNYVSGSGVDHYNRYEEDFDILKQLNLNSFRFTIEWSRIEPKEGEFDTQEILHYKKYIAELKKRNIEPFLNIWHWTMPVWFTDKGGFEKRKNIKYFTRYVQKLSEELFEDVNYVITLNEPNVYMGLSFSEGLWPPQKKSKILPSYVYYNLAVVHKKSYKIIKANKPNVQVGVAQQLANIQAYRPGHWLDESIVKIMRYFWNWWWLNITKKQQDFIGFNYYFTDYYKGTKKVNPKKPASDLDWYMEPKGILPLIQRIAYHYPNKPIIITENGLADAQDVRRKWWIEETMDALDSAISQDLPVIGYLHWSLLDNFEWATGWWPKFGLVEVDRENGMKRSIRPSAKWWAEELKKETTS